MSVVADDLTGAMDSAVQFAHAGWNAQLLLDDCALGSHKHGSVSAFVTDARALGDSEARTRTRSAASIGAERATRLFLKIDSTLRGSVGAQVGGALDAWQRTRPDAFALICPAYPAMGRTIADGLLLVNGTPVHETSIGSDPVTPLTTSSVAELIPGSCVVPAPKRGRWSKESLLAAIRVARTTSSVISVDADEQNDLAVLAEVVAEFEDDVVPVGSAGLAAALATVWGAGLEAQSRTRQNPQRMIIVASSLHDVTRSQVAALSARRCEQSITWAPTVREILDEGERAAWLSAVRATDLRHLITVIDAPRQRAEPSGAGEFKPTELIVQTLAEATSSLIDGRTSIALMLLGGEGARAVLSRLGAQRLHIHATVREGIPIGSIEGGIAAGATVITKAGGFGRRTDVADIADELLSINNEGIRQ
ncbi:four-carbon acid sugar kinase family protein [Brevibacterium sp. CFH 10365]|uniref:four-carbon acid sugar kinase family protein n=1 Tax=Brevibacterium sp. CFH 10365 TaxID=2585207 RepID=UPI00126670FE|nr:four-carbon acid sugar kinase family protein [Brevibacterium sp. CFH 10365]